MLPFVQQTPNQPGSAAPAPQQVPGGSVDLMQLQNLMQIQSQLGFVNPQLGFGNSPPGLMNFPNFNPLQNGQVGNSLLGSATQSQYHGGFVPQNFMHNMNGQSGSSGHGNPGQFFGANSMSVGRNMNQGPPNFQNGQFGWQNQMQNMNQLGNLAMFNPSQVAALAQLMGCANQVAQSMVPQNTAFGGNPPQPGVLQSNGVMQQANFGQQLPVASQPMQNVSLAPPNPMSPRPQNNQAPSWQGNRGNKHGGHIPNPNHHQNKNFVKYNQRDASSGRFQKSQDHHRNRNMKINQKFSKENGGKGVENSGPGNSEDKSNGGKRKSLAALYTEKEIQQWCEERKKNYPSQANVQKKLADKQANADAVAEEAERRRQQLKEVLAKQVELGFEVPEIPSHLVDSEDQFQGRDRNKKPFNKKGRFEKRYDKKGRFNQNNRFDKKRGTEGNDSSFRRNERTEGNDSSFKRNERFPKRQRVEGDNSSKTPLSIKEPTLLQKLLSTDIKRDKSRLLQALRFTVMNSFFKDWPEKPLSFPKVIVKENGVESEVNKEKPCCSKGELGSTAEDIDSSDDCESEKVGCQEEGEITD